MQYQVLQYVKDEDGQYNKDSYVVCLRTSSETKAKDKLMRNLKAGFRSQIEVINNEHSSR